MAGISVGAINAAIICGNPPERRRERLESFWRLVSSGLPAEPLNKDILPRTPFNEASAQLAASFGVPGFFSPRLPPSYLLPKTAPNAASYYVTSALRDTLTKLVDFDLLNSGATRLSVGAVNLTTGNFQYFDSSRQEIGPEHIMASGALPPAFPPIEIGGEHYWDGGLVSNTPLQYILDFGGPRQETCIFQIDLFSASGLPPANMGEVAQREKDIRYFSRTRMNTDVFRQTQTMRRAIRQLKHKLPAEFEHDEDWRELESLDVARRSPSCSSFIVAPLTRRKPKTTNSCAARWRTIGRPVGLTSRRRSRATLGATGCGRLRA